MKKAIPGELAMSATGLVFEMTLGSDGMLRQADRIELPPGPVRVTVEPASRVIPARRDPLEVLDEIRRMQADPGFVPRTAEDILRAEREEEREAEEYDEKWQAIYDEIDRSRNEQGGG